MTTRPSDFSTVKLTCRLFGQYDSRTRSNGDLLSVTSRLTLICTPLTDSPALAIYEYIITIEQEVSTIWKPRVSVASLILFSVRYGMLLEAVIGLITDSTLSKVRPTNKRV